MAMPVKRKLKVLSAKYVEEAKSVLMVGECSEGRFRTQVHRDSLIPQGIRSDVTEKELTKEFTQFSKSIVGKELLIVFDPDLTERLAANAPLNY